MVLLSKSIISLAQKPNIICMQGNESGKFVLFSTPFLTFCDLTSVARFSS